MARTIRIITLGIVLLVLAYFFSYRILSVPLGLTSDEGGFAVNAVELSRTGYDENGIFLPVFALSLGGKEWRQPVTQYYIAGFFKIFGTSVFNLRFSSVVVTLVSVVLMYCLAKQLFDSKWAIFASGIFLTTPLVMIQSHLALDNIMPIPFVLLWLLFLVLHFKSKKLFYLVLAGISLGIGFYTYKGMRATVPVWSILTVAYLVISEWKNKVRMLYSILAFSVGIAPFFLVIPRLEREYQGAVFDHKSFIWSSWYDFLLPYISSFDPSFLFIQGDSTLFHSTGKHGMLLLASAPLFFIGVYETIRQKNFTILILLAFFTAPLLFGFVNSVHRASRLMSMIPSYVLIATLGAKWLWQKKKVLLVVLVLVMIINYGDFVNYYWYKYNELTRNIFGDATYYQDYDLFTSLAKNYHLDKYVDQEIGIDDGPTGQFYRQVYLDDDVRYLSAEDLLPENGIMLTPRIIPNLRIITTHKIRYNVFVNSDQALPGATIP